MEMICNYCLKRKTYHNVEAFDSIGGRVTLLQSFYVVELRMESSWKKVS